MNDKDSTYESLRSWILQLPKVSEAPHRFGGVEFQVDGVEFMHSHGPTLLDIRLSNEDQATVLNSREAVKHRFAPQAGWVSFQIGKSEDLTTAKKIVQLAYDNAKKNLDDVMARRKRSGASPSPATGQDHGRE